MGFVSFTEHRFIFIGAHLLDNVTTIKHCSNIVLEILLYVLTRTGLSTTEKIIWGLFKKQALLLQKGRLKSVVTTKLQTALPTCSSEEKLYRTRITPTSTFVLFHFMGDLKM